MQRLTTKNEKLLLIIGIVIVLSSCKKNIESRFEISHSKAFVDEVIQFNNCSKNTIETKWDFGDGNNSKMHSPSHKFEDTGKYTVTLSEFDEKGNANISEELIDIYKLRLTKIKFEGIDFGSLYFNISLNQWRLKNSDKLETDITNGTYTVDLLYPYYMENVDYQIRIDTYQTYGSYIHHIIWTFDCYDKLNRDTKQIILRDEETGIMATLHFEYTH